MNHQGHRRFFVGLALLLMATIAVLAQQKQGEKPTAEAQVAEVKSTEEMEVKHQKIRGVEMSVVNSTVQDGVESPTQINLEKVLKLLNKPQPKSKPSPAAAAGLGGGKSKPKPVGGRGDSRQEAKRMRKPPEGGS